MTCKWFGAAIAAVTCFVALTGISTPSFAHQATPAPKMAKKVQPRDAKGRFVKASPSPAATKKVPTARCQGPLHEDARRDEQTKMTPKMAPPTTKKVQPRDAKGRL